MLVMYILGGLVVAIAMFAAIVAVQPADFRLSRRATMPAPPAVVFPHVNNFRNWRGWSPWENIDPDLTRTYSGAEAGAGAAYHWLGNRRVGEGRMTITESKPGEHVRIKLEFLKPFQATNLTDFTFQKEGAGTNVTWTMTGQRNFLMKAFGLLMTMDKIVGKQFEEGLANLRATVERGDAT
jgi:hypothetical protein